ncbi:hypothetical protein V1514DRAFT_339374 [Lipomyces japonicus]|uniref:uncharacterized protein n=1 Tax=Lipomyces japonicus TaxID=56871 RepID=UPI0034CDCE2E
MTQLEEGMRIEILRNEIAQRTLELNSLESIARELPSATSPSIRSISPDSGLISESSTNTSPDLSGSQFPSYLPSDYLYLYSGNAGKASTSKVIETLHKTIETLQRDLKVYTEREKKERRNRNAIQRKLESQNEQYDRMRHQNDMFDSILRRKERKVEELEKQLSGESESLRCAQDSISALNRRIKELEIEYAREKEARWRTETGYQTLVNGNQQISNRFREELKLLKSEIEGINVSRMQNSESVRLLEVNYSKMKQEKELLLEIQNKSAEVRRHQMGELRSAVTELQEKVSDFRSEDEKLINNVKQDLQKFEWLSRNSSV